MGLRAIGPGDECCCYTQLLIFALAFCVFAGIVSGIVPARQAAKMKPVDALWFEQ